jgi:hypothetical protein
MKNPGHFWMEINTIEAILLQIAYTRDHKLSVYF